MKDKSILSSIGIIIFFILTAIDKFILELPDLLYIIVGLISITLIIIGFLKDNKKQPTKNKLKTIILAFLITIILTIIYINPIYIYNNINLINHIKTINKSEIEIKDIAPFKFDKIYIASPYTSKETIEKDLGIKSRYIKNNNIQDGYQEIIFINNNKVVSSIIVSYDKDLFNINSISNNIINTKDNTYFVINKENNKYYFNEYPKTKEATFYNISFTIPGIWNEEDDEESGQFYYLDNTLQNDYLTIEQKENFNYKKYKKDITSIIEEKDIKTDNLSNIKYLKLKKDNLYEIEYIISIKEETYILKLLSEEKTLKKNSNDLLSVIKSIKEIN